MYGYFIYAHTGVYISKTLAIFSLVFSYAKPAHYAFLLWCIVAGIKTPSSSLPHLVYFTSFLFFFQFFFLNPSVLVFYIIIIFIQLFLFSLVFSLRLVYSCVQNFFILQVLFFYLTLLLVLFIRSRERENIAKVYSGSFHWYVDKWMNSLIKSSSVTHLFYFLFSFFFFF